MTYHSDDITEQLQQYHEYPKSLSPASIPSRAVETFCLRKTWLSLRLSYVKDLRSARMEQRRVRDIEAWLKECSAFGWTVYPVHPKSAQPITFKTSYALITMSAIAKKADSGWFLLEIDSVDEPTFNSLVVNGLKHACPEIYGHCMLGLGHAKLTQCAVFISSDKGGAYVHMIEYDADEFTRLVDVCRSLLSNRVAPARVERQHCGGCQYQPQCWDKLLIPKLSCYSCIYRQVGREGVFCKRLSKEMEPDVWNEGCNEHLYIPELINFAKKIGEITLENGDNAITYELADGKTMINCGARAPKKELMFTSREIEIGGALTVQNPMVQTIKEQFAGAKVISN